jgi:cytolysin (calcineurin-like family phosphatase)
LIPYSKAEESHYSFGEWQSNVTPLIEKLIPPERLRWYRTNLRDYTSTHAFAWAIYKDAYKWELSPALYDLEREYVAYQFENLVM